MCLISYSWLLEYIQYHFQHQGGGSLLQQTAWFFWCATLDISTHWCAHCPMSCCICVCVRTRTHTNSVTLTLALTPEEGYGCAWSLWTCLSMWYALDKASWGNKSRLRDVSGLRWPSTCPFGIWVTVTVDTCSVSQEDDEVLGWCLIGLQHFHGGFQCCDGLLVPEGWDLCLLGRLVLQGSVAAVPRLPVLLL